MLRPFFRTALFALAAFGAPTLLFAQSTEEVERDVLSALSTPLPITVIGPLLTRDVSVSEEGDGFRATLLDTTLMGLFPFGEVTMKLKPLEGDAYRISDLQFPTAIDIPGLANITFSGITLDGIWSATERSYSELRMELTGLEVQPGQGGQGLLSLGRLVFDVQKEPDETDTESRFDITLGDVSVSGFDSTDLTLGEAQILLSANGERPVDLYSLLREVIMVSTLRDGGIGLQSLGQSLLGNSYGTVALDLSARDLSVVDTSATEETFLRATGMQARLAMTDVNPRDWGAAELAVNLDGVQQQNLLEIGAFEVARAEVRVAGSDLPVADTFAAVQMLAMSGNRRPIRASSLLDGFAEFGALELTTEGEALSVEVRDRIYEDNQWQEDTAFVTSYESWQVRFAVAGFNNDQGSITNIVDLSGGRFEPGPLFDERDLRHVEAWFPLVMKFGGQVSNLNEAFLKKLFQDVVIADLNEPVEVILPLLLYASASAFDVAAEDNRYETALFSLTQNGAYRVFPAKFMSMAPLEGRFDIAMTGFDAILGYFEEAGREFGNAQEMSLMTSVVTVMRNLGRETADGTVTWAIEKPDVDRAEIIINGTTLFYPEINQFLPLAFMGTRF